MASSFATIYTNSYRDGIKAYNRERANPAAILLKLNPETGDFLKGLLEKEKLKELPEWMEDGEGHRLEVNGKRVEISPSMVYTGTFKLNGRVLHLREGRDIKSDFERLSRELAKPDKTVRIKKWYETMFDTAEADVVCGGLCILIIVGALIGGGVYVYSKIKESLTGSNDSLNALRAIIKEKHGQCSKDVREVDVYIGEQYSYLGKSPGDFKTFDDVKKIGEALSSFNISYMQENSQIHSMILSDISKNQIKTCEEFAQKFLDGQGVLNLAEQRRTLTAAPTSDEISRSFCQEIDNYANCLNQFHRMHLSHNGKRDIMGKDYDSESGKYNVEEPKRGILDSLKSLLPK